MTGIWLTSEQAVQVMSGSRRQGDLQERFDVIQAFARPGRLSGSLSQERLAGGRLISCVVTGWAGEQTAARDIDRLARRQLQAHTRTRKSVAEGSEENSAGVRQVSLAQRSRVCQTCPIVQKFSSGKTR